MVSSYSDLKTELANSLARSDVTANSTAVDTAIDLTEAYIGRKLRIVKMEKEATLSTVADTADVSLPSDFITQRDLAFTSQPKTIDYVPLTSFKQIYGGVGTGRPTIYTLVNDADNDLQQFRFGPTPDAVYTLDLTYIAKIPALSSENTSNWLLSYDPEMYINGGLYYLFRKYRNPLAQDYFALLDSRIKELNDEEKSKALGPSGTRIRIRGSVV